MKQKTKSDAFDFVERLQEFSRKELLKLWEVASATVRKSLEKIESVTDELSDKVN